MKTGGVKNKFTVFILFLTAFFIAAHCNFTFHKVFAASLSDNAVILLSGEIEGEEVSVDAVLMQNTGLSSLTVEIIYDADVMTLKNIEQGSALSSLDYIQTDVNTEKGYAITPFRINYFNENGTVGKENDASIGLLFQMKFSVKENIPDGKYVVALKTVEDQPPTYFEDGEDKTKRVLINGVQIEIKGNKPQNIEETTIEPEKKDNVFLWVSISVAVVAVTGLIVLTIFKIKGKRSWTKIE